MKQGPNPPQAGGPGDSVDESRLLELLEGARRRDPVAIETLLMLYEREIQRMAHRSLGPGLRSEMDSADLKQTVMREVFRDIHKPVFRQGSEFRAWLATVMHNKLRKKARDSRRKKRDGGPRLSLEAQEPGATESPGLVPPAPDPSPKSALIAEEQRLRVQAAVAALEPTQRRLVELRILQDLPWEQVAQALNMTPKAAQALWAKARLRLGKLLDS